MERYLHLLSRGDKIGLTLIRLSIAIVFMWIGLLKFVPYEADSITPFGKEQFEDVVPVLGSKVNGVQFNAELVADSLGISQIRCRCAIFLTVVFFPVLHKQAFDLISLLL